MVIYIKVDGTQSKMDMVYLILPMGIYMKDNLKMIKEMDGVYIKVKKEMSMKGNGKMI